VNKIEISEIPEADNTSQSMFLSVVNFNMYGKKFKMIAKKKTIKVYNLGLIVFGNGNWLSFENKETNI
jgi:hypothetical protein